MSQKQTRWLVNFAGGLWGLCVGLLAVGLVTALSSEWAGLFIGAVFVLALPFGVIGGTALGVRGARRLLPLIPPISFANRPLLQAAGIAVGVPATLLAGFYAPFNPLIPPSDAALIAQFTQSEGTLNRLAMMKQQDSELETVSMNWTHPENFNEAGVSSARIVEYRKLLRQTSVMSVAKFSDGAIQFPVWITGGGPASENVKGFAYLPKPPAKTYASLDGKPRAALMYRPVKENWYLYWRFIQ